MDWGNEGSAQHFHDWEQDGASWQDRVDEEANQLDREIQQQQNSDEMDRLQQSEADRWQQMEEYNQHYADAQAMQAANAAADKKLAAVAAALGGLVLAAGVSNSQAQGAPAQGGPDGPSDQDGGSSSSGVPGGPVGSDTSHGSDPQSSDPLPPAPANGSGESMPAPPSQVQSTPPGPIENLVASLPNDATSMYHQLVQLSRKKLGKNKRKIR